MTEPSGFLSKATNAGLQQHDLVGRTWLAGILEWMEKSKEQPIHPILASVLWFGVPLDAAFLAVFLWANPHPPEPKYLLVYLSALLWLNFAPGLLWVFERRLLPAFFRRAARSVDNADSLPGLHAKWMRRYRRQSWVAMVPWGVLVLLTLSPITPPPGSGFAVGAGAGVLDPFFWLGWAVITWFVVLTGKGIYASFVALFVVNETCRHINRIEPRHPDGLGGIGFVGEFAVAATLLVSTCSLFLPGFFRLNAIAEESHVSILGGFWTKFTGNWWADVLVLVFTVMLALCFLFPTFVIHARARHLRDERMYPLWEKYRKARDAGASDAELRPLQERFEEYRDVPLYPFKSRVLAALTSSLLLPLFFLILERVFLK